MQYLFSLANAPKDSCGMSDLPAPYMASTQLNICTASGMMHWKENLDQVA
jgi:hypothetical protein